MTESLIDQLVLQLLSTVSLETEGAPEASDAGWPLIGWVGIQGTPGYILEVGLTPAAAVHLSGLITGLTPDDLRADPGLCQDLANEIANVLAGNLWPVLDGATGIRLPQVGHPHEVSVGRVARAFAIDESPGLMVALSEQGE